jgi:WD40 repeat protein
MSNKTVVHFSIYSFRFVFELLGLLACLLFASQVSAQSSFVVFDQDTSAFPTIKAKFFACDANGKPFKGLTSADFKVTENGIDRPVTVASCPDVAVIKPLTVGIMINTYSYIGLAQRGTARLVNFLSMPPSECGITMMNVSTPAILQDLTRQRPKILAAVPQIASDPALEVQKMFYDPVAGGVPFVSSRPNRKILVLITDMHCPHFEFDEKQFYADAGRYDIHAYTIILGSNDYNGLFKRLADRTGGRIFENVRKPEQIDDIFAQIGIDVQQGSGCDIEWQSKLACDPYRVATIDLDSQQLSTKIRYTVPNPNFGRLEVVPSTLAFDAVQPGTTKDLTFTITARDAAFTIRSTTIGDSAYTLVAGGTPPFTLQQDESRTLTIRYASRDSLYLFSECILSDDLCSSEAIYLNGGRPSFRPHLGSLRLVKPNGGEVFLSGTDTLLQWKGVAPETKVDLSYTIDAGKNWLPIGTGLTGLRYPWHVPNTPSWTCLARVTEPGSNADTNVIILRSDPKWDSARGGWFPFAQFSPDGSLISGTEYLGQGGCIWRLDSQSVIRTSPSPGGLPGSCIMSPNGTTAATAFDDGRLEIWDITTGAVLQSIDANAGPVWEIKFNSDGKSIVSAGTDGITNVWDVASGLKRASIQSDNGVTYCVDISSDGSRLVTYGIDKIIKIWDIQSQTLVRYFSLGPGIWEPRFSRGGTELLVTNNSDALLLDANTGAMIRMFSGHSNTLTMASFSQDGTRIVTASDDKTAIVWDANTGQILNTLVGHTGPIRSAFFSPDGTKVVTAAGDTTIRVWTIENRPLEQDQSDSLWAIVAPTISLSTHDIDMKTVAVGVTKDSVVKATLCNTSAFWPLHVLGLDVTSGNSTDFMIASGAGDFTLAPGECRDVVFTFLPSAVGPEDARVTVRTSLGDFRDTIHVYGIGAGSEILLEADLIDFGTIEVNSTKDTTVSAVLKNTGRSPIKFDRDLIIGPGGSKFTVLSGAPPFTLAAGAEHAISGRFSPQDPGRVSGKILFYYTGVGSPAVVSLFGNGIGGEVYLPNDSAAPGEHILLPLKLVGPTKYLSNAGATKFRATIAFDASTLTPTNRAERGAITTDGLQTTTINATWDGLTNVLYQMPMTVGLGLFDSSVMMVTDFAWLDSKGADLPLDYTSSNGTFKLLNVCTQGGTRLYNVAGKATLSQSRPNPAQTSTSIDFVTIEQGTTTLTLTDMLGRTVETLEQSELTPGAHTIQFDASKLAPGVYYYILQTPSQRFIKALQVIR